MRNVTFKDGKSMPWPMYREMMNGRISPQAAVARMRPHLWAPLTQRCRDGGRATKAAC